MYIASRLPQILSAYRTQSTGVLSPVTFGANGIGSILRLVTALSLRDKLMALFMLCSVTCNYTLVAQILYYRRRTAAAQQ